MRQCHLRITLRWPLTLRGRLIAALLVLSAVGLTVFTGASVLLLGQSLQNRWTSDC
jgi:hypothetical protein